MGFTDARSGILAALKNGSFQHESRGSIDEKNLLFTGEVSAREVFEVILRRNGTHYTESRHHTIENIRVHVLKRDGWYIKFYFLEPDAFFISVHK